MDYEWKRDQRKPTDLHYLKRNLFTFPFLLSTNEVPFFLCFSPFSSSPQKEIPLLSSLLFFLQPAEANQNFNKLLSSPSLLKQSAFLVLSSLSFFLFPPIFSILSPPPQATSCSWLFIACLMASLTIWGTWPLHGRHGHGLGSAGVGEWRVLKLLFACRWRAGSRRRDKSLKRCWSFTAGRDGAVVRMVGLLWKGDIQWLLALHGRWWTKLNHD